MIDCELRGEGEELVEPLRISRNSLWIFTEERTKRESVRHFGIVHFHIRTKFSGRLFGIKTSTTVDDVISLRSVRHHSLPIKKVAPPDNDLGNARISA